MYAWLPDFFFGVAIIAWVVSICLALGFSAPLTVALGGIGAIVGGLVVGPRSRL